MRFIFGLRENVLISAITLFSIETMVVVQSDVGRVTAADKFFNRPNNLTETPVAT